MQQWTRARIVRAGLTGTAGLLAGLLGALPVAAFEVFNDSSDTGTPEPPIAISSAGTTVNVWLQHGSGATSTPSDVCSGAGLGDEVCGWDIRIETTGGVQIDSFTPTGDVVWNVTAAGTTSSQLFANGGNPIDPTPVPEKIGEAEVSASSAGELRVTGNLYVTSDLAATAVPEAVIGIAVDADNDGLLNADDNCPNLANPGGVPFPDTGGVQHPDDNPDGMIPDGIGDNCQCGDVNDDGRVTGNDGTFIKRACLGLAPFENTVVGETGCAQSQPGPPDNIQPFNRDKCDVGSGGGGPGACSGNDATVVRRRTLGLLPAIINNCPGSL